MYAVSFIYPNLSPHCFHFSFFQGNFFLSKDNGLFHRYHCRRLSSPSNLLISLSPKSVTTRSYFHHLEGGRVAEVHKEASSNYIAERTAIHHRSRVPKGWLTRGGVPQMLRYIYAPPAKKTSPYHT